jgi:Holliday junction DNA helicase RuvA
MIGSLRGTLLERSPRRDTKDPCVDVLIECGGVGYRAAMTANAATQLGELGSSAFIHTYTHVREDNISLFGFSSRDERNCFSALIATHGIGPSVALAILSTHTPANLMRAVHNNDVDALCSVPGIGKKTAAKLMVELQSRLDEPVIDLAVVPEPPTDGTADPRNDVRTALAGLGYSADEIRGVVQNLPIDEDAEVLLREALRRLAVSA